MGTKSTTLMEIVNARTRTEPFSREIGNLTSIRWTKKGKRMLEVVA